MKNLYLLLIAFSFSVMGFGQTQIFNEPLDGAVQPTGWTDTNVNYPAGYANFTAQNALLDSPTFNGTGFTAINVSYGAAKIQTGQATNAMTAQYSINGGTSWVTLGSISPTATTPIYTNFTITTFSSTMKVRFIRLAAGSRLGLVDVVVSGVTACATPNNLPFVQGFEATTFPPTCWATYRGSNGTGTGQDWQRVTTPVNSGGGAAYVRWESNGSTNEDWLVTPAINLTATSTNTLTFWTRDANAANFNSSYTIRVSTTSQTNRASFTTVQTYTEAQLGQAYNQKTINLNAYAGSNVYIAFVLTNDNGDSFYVDDVKITGSGTICTAPSPQATNYSTTNINAPFGGNATLNWTRGGGDNVLVVMREGSAVNADPVSGTAYAGNTAFGNGTEIGTGNFVVYNGPASNVNVTNLGFTQTYHVAIYEYNTTGICYKTPALIGNFVVPCGTAGLPFTEGFNGTAFPPACWTTYRGANGVGTGFDWSRVTANTRTGAGAAFVRYEDVAGTNTNPAEDWLVTPQIDLNSTTGNTLKFWCRDNPFTDNSNYTVRVSTTSQTNRNSFTTVATYTAFGATYLEQTVNLSAYDGQSVYIAFVMINDDGDNWFIDDVSVTGNIKYTYDNAWIPSSPIGVSTSANTIVIANGNAVFTGNTQSNNITVNPTAAITVNAGITLSSTNGLTLQSNTTQYSSLVLDGTITGTVNYNRHVNGGTGVAGAVGSNDLISAPVTGQTFASFVAANPLNIKSDPNNANRKLFGPFNKATGTYDLWTNTAQAQANNTLIAGVGYRAASTDNGGFTFTGTPNKGIITNNIVNSAGVQFAAYNLIGNPYPSYINVRGFLEYDVEPGAAVVRNIDLMDAYGAIYGYDGNTAGANNSGWVVYNLTTATTVNMAPGQGFLVTADAADVAAYDMTFAPSMRRIGTTDDFIPNRVADENNVHVKLQAAIGTDVFNTDIFFNDNTTSGLDFGYDAGMFGANAPTKAIYSQLVDNNTGVDMAIQALAFTALGTDISVPLGINALQGEQVTVSIAESDLPSDIEVYLEDNVTGTSTLLNTSDYVFTPSATLTDTGRFFLRFTDQTLATPDNSMIGLQIYATASPRALLVKGLLTATTSVQVYDIQGRLVLSSQLEASSTSNQVDVSSLNTGVYVVKLNNSTQQKTQKIILK